jgi:hypothetical protein
VCRVVRCAGLPWAEILAGLSRGMIAVGVLRRPVVIPRLGSRGELGSLLGKEFPMRSLTRMGLGLVGLALVAPTAIWADPPASNPSAGKKTRPKTSIFHRTHLCAQCQWSDLKARGINAPPPPPITQGGQMSPGSPCDRCGAVTLSHALPRSMPPQFAQVARAQPAMTALPAGMAAGGAQCVACEAVATGTPVTVAGGAAPGRAVVGGSVPGYAVINESVPMSEPTPIGTIQGRYAFQNQGGPAARAAQPMPGGPQGLAGAGPKSSDPSVMPSSFAADPYVSNARSRPHILQHLFGLDALNSHKREEAERRERETHAAISYQPQTSTVVTELPTEMVYGR